MLSERTNGFAQHLAIEPVLGLLSEVEIYCGLIDASLGREGADTGGFIAALGDTAAQRSLKCDRE